MLRGAENHSPAAFRRLGNLPFSVGQFSGARVCCFKKGFKIHLAPDIKPVSNGFLEGWACCVLKLKKWGGYYLWVKDLDCGYRVKMACGGGRGGEAHQEWEQLEAAFLVSDPIMTPPNRMAGGLEDLDEGFWDIHGDRLVYA